MAFRRKSQYASNIPVSGFKNRKGEMVRTRPENIKFVRKGDMVSVGSRGHFADRLKSARAGMGKKAALHLKRQARKLTYKD